MRKENDRHQNENQKRKTFRNEGGEEEKKWDQEGEKEEITWSQRWQTKSHDLFFELFPSELSLEPRHRLLPDHHPRLCGDPVVIVAREI